jgi:hypothetical protein
VLAAGDCGAIAPILVAFSALFLRLGAALLPEIGDGLAKPFVEVGKEIAHGATHG